MKETRGNLWDQPGTIVITTNGAVRKDGACVMGAGCARQARDTHQQLPYYLGHLIQEHGNRVFNLGLWNGQRIVTFPVKHHWAQQADKDLIVQSAYQLVELADKFGWAEIVLPRPGCGNGKLTWVEVKPLLEPILNDRFTVITY